MATLDVHSDPAAAVGLVSATGSGAWVGGTLGGWATVETTLATDIAVTGVMFQVPETNANTTLREVLVEIATGPSGGSPTTTVIQVPCTIVRQTNVGYILDHTEVIIFPEPIFIAANSSVFIRALHSGAPTTATNYDGMKIIYEEPVTAIVIQSVPASFTASSVTNAQESVQSPADGLTFSSQASPSFTPISRGTVTMNGQPSTIAEATPTAVATTTFSSQAAPAFTPTGKGSVTMSAQPSSLAEATVSGATVTMSNPTTVGEIVNSLAALVTASAVNTPAFAPTAKGTVTMSSVISTAEVTSPPPSTITFSSITDFTNGGSGAPLLSKVGSFAGQAGAGNQAITGVGFQPKVVLVWSDHATADHATTPGGGNTQMPMCFGMTDGASACCWTDSDDFSSGNPGYDNTNFIIHRTGPGTITFAATIVSLDSDGFTINFSTPSNGIIVNYLALGGSALSNVFLKKFVGPSTGGNFAVTGVGFQPDSILVLGGTAPGSTSFSSIGFASASAQAAASVAYDGAINRYQRTSKVYIPVGGGLHTTMEEATRASFDSDGFTLNFTTESTAGTTMAALCLKGARVKVGSFTQKTSPGSQPTTGVGFQPKALLLASVLNVASAVLDNTRLVMMIGGTDGTSRSVIGTGDNNRDVSWLDRTKVYASYADDGTPTLEGAADITSFDSDGFTLNYTTADATAREIIYFAFGDAPGGGGGAITITQPSGSHTMSAISTVAESLASPPPLVTFSNPSAPAFTPSARGSFTAGVGSVSAAESLIAPVASLTASASQTAAEALTQPPGAFTASSGMSPSFTPTGKGTFTASAVSTSLMSAQSVSARLDFSAISTVPGIALAIQDVPASFTANRGVQSAAESLNSPAANVTMNASQTAAESAVSRSTVMMQSVTTISWALSKFASSTFSSAGGTLAEAAVPNSATVTFSRLVTTEQAIHVPAGSMTLSAASRVTGSLTSPAALVTFNTGPINFTYLLTSLRHYIMQVGSPATRILSTTDKTEITSATPETTRLRRVEGNG